MIKPVSFRWSTELVARIDLRRGDVPRSVWVRRAVERALDGSQQDVALRGAASGEMPAGPSPAPAEQPEDVERALEGLDHSPCRVDVGDRDPVPAPAEQPKSDAAIRVDPKQLADAVEFPEGPPLLAEGC